MPTAKTYDARTVRRIMTVVLNEVALAQRDPKRAGDERERGDQHDRDAGGPAVPPRR